MGYSPTDGGLMGTALAAGGSPAVKGNALGQAGAASLSRRGLKAAWPTADDSRQGRGQARGTVRRARLSRSEAEERFTSCGAP